MLQRVHVKWFPWVEEEIRKIKQPTSAKKHARNISLTTLGSVASAALMSQFVPLTIAISSTSTLVSHEFGHYYSTLLRNGQPRLPVVIPAGPVSVGITDVKNYHGMSKRSKRYALYLGAATGAVAALHLVPLMLITNTYSVMLFLGILLGELFSITLGSDGKKIQNLKKA